VGAEGAAFDLRLQREQEPASPFVFTSERGSPSPLLALPAWLSLLARRRGLASRRIPTCSDTPALRLANKGHATRDKQSSIPQV